MKLLLLRCPKCSEPLKPAGDEVLAVCHNCFEATELSAAGLKPLTIQYAKPTEKKVTSWLPVWVFSGWVNLLRRENQIHYPGMEEEAKAMWKTVRYFLVPAWGEEFPEVYHISQEWLEEQPTLKAIPRPENIQLAPVKWAAADAQKLLDFVVVSTEAERIDFLKTIQFDIHIEQTALWAIPADANRKFLI